MTVLETIQSLRAELNLHNHNYYVLDNPTISDFDFDLKLKQLQHTYKIWYYRDEYCTKLIKKMRLNGIPSVEPSGEYFNLPTIEELKLIKMLSSNICCEELEQIEKMLKEKGY